MWPGNAGWEKEEAKTFNQMNPLAGEGGGRSRAGLGPGKEKENIPSTYEMKSRASPKKGNVGHQPKTLGRERCHVKIFIDRTLTLGEKVSQLDEEPL